MKNDKTRMDSLIKWADQALKEQEREEQLPAGISRILNGDTINSSYDVLVASLGVSVVMSGLLPTLAMYYQDYGDGSKAARRNVLDVVARIITLDETNDWDFSSQKQYACELLRRAIEIKCPKVEKKLREEVIGCTIALKQVVRTYNLVKA